MKSDYFWIKSHFPCASHIFQGKSSIFADLKKNGDPLWLARFKNYFCWKYCWGFFSPPCNAWWKLYKSRKKFALTGHLFHYIFFSSWFHFILGWRSHFASVAPSRLSWRTYILYYTCNAPLRHMLQGWSMTTKASHTDLRAALIFIQELTREQSSSPKKKKKTDLRAEQHDELHHRRAGLHTHQTCSAWRHLVTSIPDHTHTHAHTDARSLVGSDQNIICSCPKWRVYKKKHATEKTKQTRSEEEREEERSQEEKMRGERKHEQWRTRTGRQEAGEQQEKWRSHFLKPW